MARGGERALLQRELRATNRELARAVKRRGELMAEVRRLQELQAEFAEAQGDEERLVAISESTTAGVVETMERAYAWADGQVRLRSPWSALEDWRSFMIEAASL